MFLTPKVNSVPIFSVLKVKVQADGCTACQQWVEIFFLIIAVFEIYFSRLLISVFGIWPLVKKPQPKGFQRSCPSRVKLRQVRSRTKPISGAVFYTGWMSLTGLVSGCAFRCTSVNTASLLDTWSISASQSPALTATGICDLQAVISCRFHGPRWQSTEAVLLDMPVRLLGTLCRKLSKAVYTVYLLSDVI